MKVYTIGRSGDQAFKIPDEKDGVSNRHASLTIGPDGKWILEDLKGMAGNGTFIKDDNGEWKPILKCIITPNTQIRLGKFHSFTFMAHRVVSDDPNDLSYEFSIIRKQWKYYSRLISQEQQKLKKRKQTVNIIAISGIVLGVVLSMFQAAIGLSLSGVSGAAMIARMVFAPDSARLNEIMKTRQQMAVCPNCGKHLSEHDVNDMSCSICHAR